MKPAGRPGATWEGQLGARGGDGDRQRERERETERSVPGMWWYHRSSSPTGPLPKKEMKREDKEQNINIEIQKQIQ